MKTTVILHGSLSEFGERRELELSCPAEALKAIEALRPGFLSALRRQRFALVLKHGESAEVVDDRRLRLPVSGEELHILPVPSGEIETMIYWVATALYSTGLGYATSVTLATVAVNVAATVAITSVATALMPMPQMGDPKEAPESKPSYYFNGPVNTTKQGNVVPVCYGGPLLIGSQVISASVSTEDLALDA